MPDSSRWRAHSPWRLFSAETASPRNRNRRDWRSHGGGSGAAKIDSVARELLPHRCASGFCPRHSGMSFGGTTSGSVCLDDPNCAAFINMDGSNHDGRLINASAGKPTMMFHSDWTIMFKQMTEDEDRDFSDYGFNDLSYETHEEAGLSDDVIRLRVKDVTHGGVSDFSLFIKGPIKNMTLGEIDGPRMITIMNDFVVGFFDKYVRDSSENPMDIAFEKHQGYVEKYDTSYVREWWMAKTDKEREELLKHKPIILEAFDSL